MSEVLSKYMTIVEAAKICKVSRQAIYGAVKSGRVKSKVIMGVICVSRSDIERKFNRYSRSLLIDDEGNKAFDRNNISVVQAAKMIGCKIHCIYYLINSGAIKPKRLRSTIILNNKDVSDIRWILESKK